MRLSRATDFALRILMLLAKEDRALSISDISSRLGLSNSHVMKLVAKLGNHDLVETQRGRGGGVRLSGTADAISIGSVVRIFETDFAAVDCLRSQSVECCFLPRCALKPVIAKATHAFLSSLDETSLASVAKRTQAPRS